MKTKNLSLSHLVRPASNAVTNPTVLFLFHGYGSDEADLYSFSEELPSELFIISARAPFALQPFGYCWYAINFGASSGKWSDVEQACTSRDLILKFIDEAVLAYRLNPNNINLLGFSQGTVLSYAVALSYPDKFRNVIALSGYIDENILVEDYAAKDHSKLKIYASHGQVDQVIPPEWAQRVSPKLKSLGIEHIYEEFPAGHGVSPQNFYSFKKWLEANI
ncbi:MAG: alpha/beta hydrolase [Flavobacteriaceae bacterium]